MWLFLVLPFHGFLVVFPLLLWLVQGFETFPTLPTKPSENVTAVTAFGKRKQNGKFETCSGTGFIRFCNLSVFDTGQYWFYPLLFTFSLEDMCFKLFYFRSTRPWLGSMRSLLSLLNNWFCCKFTFLVFVIFTKKWIRVGGAKREDFHKIMSNLPSAGLFLFSLDKSYLVHLLRNVYLWYFALILSLSPFYSLVLFCIFLKI